ncbi:MAG TPA: glycosyltransferase family A protein [Steroidobacteraceae bacterium]|nr:glycosyltransferase family A protein [Steroidobacteraceae bacterium]
MASVSIIIPAYNRTKFLALAVQSAVNQTHSDWELIIADDGSDEETNRYLRGISAPAVRIVWLPHSGNPSLVRNAAAAAASGRYLAFLDSDDEWAPQKLERQLAALRDQPQCRWSYTACRHIDEGGHLIPKKRAAPPAPEGWIFRQLLTLEIGIAMPTVVTERSLFEEVGGFDEQQLFGEFHDLCLRLALKGEVVVVREPLCSVRVHGEHYSSDRTANHAGWFRLYQKMAATTDDPGLRAYCVRMQADESLNLARAQADKGEYRTAWTTLGRALSFSWRYPHWWWGAFRGVIRRCIANAVAALRHGHSSK